ncbi:MAG: hypothetical protein KY459_08835 [Acidobacteria bacterium]|nr:hypothetical protein [Acidobacteriota bacterium]
MNEPATATRVVRTSPIRIRSLVLFAILILASSVTAQEATPPAQDDRAAETPEVPGEPDPADSTQDERDPEAAAEPEGEEPAATTEQPGEDTGEAKGRPRDPCSVENDPDEPRLDQFRREVFESVCESAAWFDGFFGNQRFDEEARRTNGRVGALLVYDEFEGVEIDGTLKVRVDFPNLEHRVNAFLGREDTQDFLSGTERQLDFLPAFFEREGNQDWLLGLGYRPVGNDRSSLDFDVGIEVESPIDPFVRGQYRYLWLIGDDSLLRARQTLYWTNQRGVGTGTRVDFERPVGTRTLVRWVGNVIHDDETEGLDWDTGITLYHGFSNDRAASWFIGIDGETERVVPIEVYGTRVTYRQRMLREWFFGQVVTGVTWPKDDPTQSRDLAWHIGFGFEIFFSGEDLGLGR